jgi:hypothetical protein
VVWGYVSIPGGFIRWSGRHLAVSLRGGFFIFMSVLNKKAKNKKGILVLIENEEARMGKIFDAKGKLNIPLEETISIPESKIKKRAGEIVVNEAYCPKGHSLMSEVEVDNEPGLHFIYTDKAGKKETDIVISSVVRKCRKKILKGKAFEKGEIVKILCPICRTELDVMFDCECGAPIYLFYLDKQRNNNYGQSFCSRIGCVKASQLRFSQDMLQEFMIKYAF